jgi:hypothetical protein
MEAAERGGGGVRERSLHLRVRGPPLEVADVQRRVRGRRGVGGGAATAGRHALRWHRHRHVVSRRRWGRRRRRRRRPRRLVLRGVGFRLRLGLARGAGLGLRRRDAARRWGRRRRRD